MLRAVRARGAVAAEPEVGRRGRRPGRTAPRGACFRPELATAAGRLPAEVDEGLWDLVARGIVTADAFSAVRSLLSARDRWRTRTSGAGRRPGPARPGRRRAPVGTGIGEGRWSLLPGRRRASRGVDGRRAEPGNEELAEAVAWQLLTRWGVVAWECGPRVVPACPGARWSGPCAGSRPAGLALGGRFVAGLSGEQYALPEAAAALRRCTAAAPSGRALVVAGADPLNVTGSSWAAPRVPDPAEPARDVTATASWWTISVPGERRRCRSQRRPRGPRRGAGRSGWPRAAGLGQLGPRGLRRPCRRAVGSMRATVVAALRAGVAVGAHPSYPDRAGSAAAPDGRWTAGPGARDLLDQLGRRWARWPGSSGASRVVSVKPHGALYGRWTAIPTATSDALATGMWPTFGDLRRPLVCSPALRRRSSRAERPTRVPEEGFADRAYGQRTAWVAVTGHRAGACRRSGAAAARAAAGSLDGGR